ncbi:hypothetical protein V502_08930 [Pseudogymnoascus sp. VKM F-4520 (FW-2644)]|nr:hypothetical protein V502_08930 [Pseudogymnoascus sp. VKM F-4520 (FW-2644)]
MPYYHPFTGSSAEAVLQGCVTAFYPLHNLPTAIAIRHAQVITINHQTSSASKIPNVYYDPIAESRLRLYRERVLVANHQINIIEIEIQKMNSEIDFAQRALDNLRAPIDETARLTNG